MQERQSPRQRLPGPDPARHDLAAGHGTHARCEMTDPPNDAPHTGDALAMATVSASCQCKLRPHHRPAVTEVGEASDAMASLVRAIAELVRVEVDAQVRAALAERPAVDELLSTAE